MNVSLTPDLEQFIANKVSTGRYQTASEVVREGLRLLEERDQNKKPNFMFSSMEELREKVQEGVDALDRGEYTVVKGDEDLSKIINDIKAKGRDRLKKAARQSP